MSLREAVALARRRLAEKADADAAGVVRVDVYRAGEAVPRWDAKRPQDTWLLIRVPA